MIKFGTINEEVPFCLAKGDIVNCRYKNRLDRYCIFTSLLQLIIVADWDDWFLDETFNISPKNWYQDLNILVYKKNNIYLSLTNISMSHKSYELYNKIFKDLLFLFEQSKIESLLKNINNNFDKPNILWYIWLFEKVYYKN